MTFSYIYLLSMSTFSMLKQEYDAMSKYRHRHDIIIEDDPSPGGTSLCGIVCVDRSRYGFIGV